MLVLLPKHRSEQKAFLTLSTQTPSFLNTDTTPFSFHARWPFAVPHRPGVPEEVTREKDDRRPEAADAVAHLYCEANRQPIEHPGELGDPVVNRLRPKQARKRWLTQVQVPGSQGSSDLRLIFCQITWRKMKGEGTVIERLMGRATSCTFG